MRISIDHVTWEKGTNNEIHESMGVFIVPDNDKLFSTPGFCCHLCLSKLGIEFLNLSDNPYNGIYNVTVLEDDEREYNIEGDTLNTVQDLINYLSTLDPKKYICGEYIRILLNEYLGNESRPLLKSLIKDEGDHYTFGPMIY